MTRRGDYPDDMDEPDLDDARAEALLRGEAPPADWQLIRVAAFVRDLRATASRPAPAPSPALAAVLRDGLPSQNAPDRAPGRRSSRAGWRRWVAVAGIGTGVAMTSVVGAGAAGLLPGPAERVVADVVHTLTPLELPQRATDDRRAAPTVPRTPTTRTQAGAAGSAATAQPSVPTSTTPPAAVGPSTSVPPTSRVPAAPSGPGVTTSTVTVAPGPSAGTVPTTSTTLPGLPPLPLPTLPDVVPTLPGPLRLPPITVPRLPW